jgi:hypothetical protein
MTLNDVSEAWARDRPSSAAPLSELTDFANSFPGYDMWGSHERLAEVRDAVLDSIGNFGHCTSIFRLRTAMFALAGAARFTDGVDGAFEMPREAANEDAMRDVLSHIELATIYGPREDARLAEAVRLVALDRALEDPTFHERDLRDRLLETLKRLWEPVADVGLVERSLGQLSGWAPNDPPGKFDLGLAYSDMMTHANRYRVLAETKLSDRNTVSHSIWDAAKLISALVARADHVYLIGGWPVSVWEKARAAALYSDGVVDFKAMMELPGEWSSLLKHSKGTPLRLPSRLLARQLARVPFPRREPHSGTQHDWELRAAALEPAAGDWLFIPDGEIGMAVLEHEHMTRPPSSPTRRRTGVAPGPSFPSTDSAARVHHC